MMFSDFSDAFVYPLEYSDKAEFSTGVRLHYEFPCGEGIDLQIQSVNQKKRVCRCEGYWFIATEKGVISRNFGIATRVCTMGFLYGESVMGHSKAAQSKRLASALIIVFGLTACAAAQAWPPPRPAAPERTARLQYVSGEVSIAPKDTNQWTTARLYQTLTPAEYIWTAKDSRAEISLGYGFFRMNSEASVTLIAINRGMVQIGVNQGEVTLTILHLFPGEIYEIDTPNATLTASKAGVYRVEVHPDADQTLVTARKGAMVATGQGPAVTVDSGKQVLFSNRNSLQHTVTKAPPRDGFEDWASVRDQRLGAGRPPFVVFGYGPWPYAPGPPPPPPPVWVR
jgi:hypothetical protein